MPTPAKNTRNLITWRDTSDGSHGIVTHGLNSPHYVQIQRGGAWAVSTLDAKDKPVFVKQGTARNVSKAKRLAEDAIKALVTGEDTQNEATKTNDPAPWIRTVKIYFGLFLTVLACLIFGRYLLFHRPAMFARVVLWGGASAFIAHRLIVWFVDMARRVDYLTGRKASPAATPVQSKQQPMKLPSLPSGKRPKALPSGKR
jgi:hypothetical protein